MAMLNLCRTAFTKAKTFIPVRAGREVLERLRRSSSRTRSAWGSCLKRLQGDAYRPEIAETLSG